MAVDARKATKERVGSKVSTKQLARAAVEGREVTFDGLGISGYVIGSDDYHWLLAHIERNEDGWAYAVSTVLVHKSAPVVRVARQNTLEDLPEKVRDEVQSLGANFVAYCQREILGQR